MTGSQKAHRADILMYFMIGALPFLEENLPHGSPAWIFVGALFYGVAMIKAKTSDGRPKDPPPVTSVTLESTQ